MKKIIFGFSVCLLFLFIITVIITGIKFEEKNNEQFYSSELSAEVERYRPTVELIAKEEEVEEYIDLILCVMQQESAGTGGDPMQASEGAFNIKYPNIPNGITDAIYSIECGIKELKDCLTRAKVENKDDIENIKVALQGYNFGNGYIEWCQYNYNSKWTNENATIFSNMMMQRLGWNSYGDTLYPERVLNYYLRIENEEGFDKEALKDDDFAKLINEAEKYIGMPYVFGGSTPATSFDCSGFVCWVYTTSNVYNLPRTTAQGIYNQCYPVTKDKAKPGDLIFFQNTYNCPDKVTHIGIYVGNNQMLHCGDPIGYESINLDYWVEKFYGFGRLK